jgi:hypothetical protein
MANAVKKQKNNHAGINFKSTAAFEGLDAAMPAEN